MSRRFFVVVLAAFLVTSIVGGAWATPREPEPEPTDVSPMPEAMAGYGEAPQLAAMVAAGELPPVEERLPVNPLVVTPIEEVGQYGGTLRTLAGGPGPWNSMQVGGGTSQGLLRLSPDGSEVLPNAAMGYDFSADFKTFTVYLREGLKWSDGAPLTADDFVFMAEDMNAHENINTWYAWGDWELEKLGPFTIRYTNDEPDPSIEAKMGWSWSWSWFAFQPKHYLEKWHIDYNPDAAELAAEEGFENWWDAFRQHSWHAPQKDFDMPTINPWTLTDAGPTFKTFDRNPYYFKVDTASNQLPYIDGISVSQVDAEVAQLKIISGEVDVEYAFGSSLENYSVYKENEAAGNYRTILVPSSRGSEVTLILNLNEQDPAKREIYQNVDFRRALSLAINRDEINETVFFGLAVPRQATALPTVSFYDPEWGNSYAEYDPAQANALLDKVGLTERSSGGFRLGPDGEELLMMIEYTTGAAGSLDSALELVKDYWEDVGIKAFLKSEERQFFRTRAGSTDFTLIARHIALSDEAMMYMEGGPGDFRVGSFARNWSRWINAKEQVDAGEATLDDFEGGVLPGEEPPQEYKDLESWVDRITRVEYASDEFRSLGRSIFGFHAENVFLIGTVGLVPKPWIVNADLRNVPDGTRHISSQAAFDSTGWGDQFFFKN